MPHLHDVLLIFHEPDCPGLITSDDNDWLMCAECGQTVGQVDPIVLASIIGFLDKR